MLSILFHNSTPFFAELHLDESNKLPYNPEHVFFPILREPFSRQETAILNLLQVSVLPWKQTTVTVHETKLRFGCHGNRRPDSGLVATEM